MAVRNCKNQRVLELRDAREGDHGWEADLDQVVVQFGDGHVETVLRKEVTDDPIAEVPGNVPGALDQPGYDARWRGASGPIGPVYRGGLTGPFSPVNAGPV